MKKSLKANKKSPVSRGSFAYDKINEKDEIKIISNYSASAITDCAAVRPETKISEIALPPSLLPPK